MMSYKFINYGSNVSISAKDESLSKGKKRIKGAIPGIREADIGFYKPDATGRFQCRDESEWIQFSRVNDDFCDCVTDGSDEPGTDACPNGR